MSIEHYASLLKQQSVRQHTISQKDVTNAFSDLTINADLIGQLGSAMHSRKAVLIYGDAGTGKTYVCSRLPRLLGDSILIPHAVAVGKSIVRVHDSTIHTAAANAQAGNPLLLKDTYDPRFALCERPFVVSGGELTGDMLEVTYDPSTRQYHAPLQLKAGNGIYLIDDLGRQKIATAELFNRWIVPMESGTDYLNLASGDRMIVPFDLILMFSTNLNPNDLADAAFLRRIGHKIKFNILEPHEYAQIWSQVCTGHNIRFDQQLVDYVIDHLHKPNQIDLLACHPRDLVGAALDYLDYMQLPRELDLSLIHI